MKRLYWFAATAALAGIATTGWFGWTRLKYQQELQALVEKTRANLIYVEGGSFEAGNYMVEFLYEDGTLETAWAEDLNHPAAYPVELQSYYISAYETSYGDFNLYLAAHGYPVLKAAKNSSYYLPDRAAEIVLEEAVDYCRWLGEQVGVEMRLPTEAEWEFAARSRGQIVLWPTDDGNYRPGENVYTSPDRDVIASQDEHDPPIGSYPPNPMGLYNLADGAYEWVSDRLPSDPSASGIWKGGSNHSTRYQERIPGRGVSEGSISLESFRELLKDLPPAKRQRYERLKNPLGPKFPWTTARCVADETRPPDQSGFGILPEIRQLKEPFTGTYD